MELTKTEVFECVKCGLLSKDEGEIKKCLDKHKKQDLKAQKEKVFYDICNKLNNFMIDNLKSLNKEDIRIKLEEASKIIGYNLVISSISSPRINADYRENIYASYNIEGCFKRDGSASEFNGIKKPSGWGGGYLSSLLDKKYSSYFGDFIRVLNGLDTGSGGGGENFRYEVKIHLKHFTELNAAYKEYIILEEASKDYSAQVNVLTKKYEAERVPVLLHSDIPYQEIKMQSDELSFKIRELQSELSEINKNLQDRKTILIKNDSPKFVTPDSSFQFDSERLKEVKASLLG